MSEIESIERRSHFPAKILVNCTVLYITLILTAYFSPALHGLQVPLAYLAPFLLAVGLVPSLILYWSGPATLPILPFSIGAVLLMGGTAFDMLATVLRSPTLIREGNPIARALLDGGHSLTFLYGYGFATQSLYVLFACTLWAAFLRHLDVVIALADRSRPKSYLEFVKAMTGGGQLSWRQYLLPMKPGEFSKPYFLVWILPIFWVGLSPYRWFLALEWLGMAPMPRNSFVAFLVIAILLLYLVWLWYEYLKSIQRSNMD